MLIRLTVNAKSKVVVPVTMMEDGTFVLLPIHCYDGHQVVGSYEFINFILDPVQRYAVGGVTIFMGFSRKT